MSDTFIDSIMAYESGDLGIEQTLDLFSSLIESGMAWKLQGSYGRTAAALIENGYINDKGTLTSKATDLIDEQD